MAADFPQSGGYTGVRGDEPVKFGPLPRSYSQMRSAAAQIATHLRQLRVGVAARVQGGGVATVDSVRELALRLPRSHEVLIRDRVKFRVGRIVYLAFSRDERLLGFAFPKEERESLVASEPTKFEMPGRSDLRYNWVVVRLGAVDDTEMRELVVDAWRMAVPKRVAAAYCTGSR